MRYTISIGVSRDDGNGQEIFNDEVAVVESQEKFLITEFPLMRYSASGKSLLEAIQNYFVSRMYNGKVSLRTTTAYSQEGSIDEVTMWIADTWRGITSDTNIFLKNMNVQIIWGINQKFQASMHAEWVENA